MASLNGRYVVCYNGEIYNCEELRAQIEAAWAQCDACRDQTRLRRKWRGHSDTEVILEGLSLWGPEFVAQLNGIFAFALYDREQQSLCLARDRMGIKPLYTWSNDRVFMFASEAKFFFQTDHFRPEVNRQGLAQYLTYGHSTGAARLLEGVAQVTPGERWLLNCKPASRSAPEKARFCCLPHWNSVERSDRSAALELRQLMEKVVESQLVADVPVGVFLSGGVDSSILTALASKVLGPSSTKAFTLGYQGFGADFDELQEAGLVANHLGVRQYVLQPTAEQLIKVLEQVVWHHDEPFADAAALNVFALSKFVRSEVTVALAGEGADELFGGYRRYQVESWLRYSGPLLRLATVASKGLKLPQRRLPRRLAILCRSISYSSAAERYSAYFEGGMPAADLIRPEWQWNGDPRSDLRELYPESLDIPPVAAMCVADQRFWLVDTYLEKSDKGSMAHSLEIRVPFLDNRLLEFANSLPDRLRIRGSQRKWLLRAAFADLLPEWVFTRFKRGFGVPLSDWLRNELKPLFVDTVLAPKALSSSYLQQPKLEQLFTQHCRSERDYSVILWQVLAFELWLRHVAAGFGRLRTA
jgi:asparagine synthase (glutamine-hydrolysing)